jgi:hypothetical protein
MGLSRLDVTLQMFGHATVPMSACSTTFQLVLRSTAMSQNKPVGLRPSNMEAMLILPVASNSHQITCAGVPIESRVNYLFISLTVISVLLYITAGLRFFIRWRITKRFWWDDWTMMIATVGFEFFPWL